MPASGKLQGIFTPNLVPYDSRGEINERELRRYVDWLIEKGVHGLYPNGSTGEFTRFTVEERRRIAEIIADQTRGRVPILAGAAEANVKETLRACEFYAELGVRAVAIVAPFYYKLSPSSVYAYFHEIGRNTPIDVTLYNIPMFASPIDVPTVQRLSESCERIVAIKDSSGDLPHMIRMITAVRPNRPDFSFLTGWDAALMPMLLVGCDGGTNASSGVVPELTRKLYDLTLSGQLDAARQIQYDLVTLFDTMLYQAEFPDGFRKAADLRGFTMGNGRQPLSKQQQADLSTLSNTLQCLLANHGFADQPVRGCAPGTFPRTADALRSFAGAPSVSPADDVSHIVQGVVAELKRRGMM
ncbi:MAG: dihydrodipicolinate synthase family protein [Planctomycetaceae bacterium]|nr:dihydrodipicolinate synthase family protein [Planctomycetaceae bacterium]